MVDKDFAEINALSAVFPESSILLCWYHVLQVNVCLCVLICGEL